MIVAENTVIVFKMGYIKNHFCLHSRSYSFMFLWKENYHIHRKSMNNLIEFLACADNNAQARPLCFSKQQEQRGKTDKLIVIITT